MKLVLLLAVVLFAGCASYRGVPPQHGVPNLDRVDESLWRGGQPTRLGLEWLASQGVKSVINLRDDEWPMERQNCSELGLVYVNLPLSGVKAAQEDVIKSYYAVFKTLPKPAFVHCQFGCDRTGEFVAFHRIETGWSNQDAAKEAKAFGASAWLPNFHEAIVSYRP